MLVKAQYPVRILGFIIPGLWRTRMVEVSDDGLVTLPTAPGKGDAVILTYRLGVGPQAPCLGEGDGGF